MPEKNNDKTLAQHVGENIKTLRTAQGLSQYDVSMAMRSLGFKWFPQHASKVERGGCLPRLDALVALAIVFDRPLWRLLDTSEGHDTTPSVEVGERILLAPSELGQLASMSPRNVWRVDESGEQTVNLSMRGAHRTGEE